MSLLHTPQKAERRELLGSDSGAPLADGDQARRPLAEQLHRLLNARRHFRQIVLARLSRINTGQLTLVESNGTDQLGEVGSSGLAATIRVINSRFYEAVVLGGALGAAEAYLRGDWDSPDLTAVMRVMTQNSAILAANERGVPQLLRPLRSAANWLQRNTRVGSKRNIAAHYDLSNEFFALMLDPTMTYSSGVFPAPTATLEEASVEKYDIICRKLKIGPRDHVLEIGTGWGGFAEHAVTHYGCRVTSTTISEAQHDYAAQRFRQVSPQDRVTLLNDDYRDLRGKYDKLVSIEMIEAVGEKFLQGYFGKCSELLKQDGMMLLQAITIPDYRYADYRKSVDFIQRYIFPGGFLPSLSAMTDCVGRATDLRCLHGEDFGPHYARTLAAWRDRFWGNIDQVKGLGFDDRFVRTWHYYLCYCEAGFRERQIGVSQLLFAKPDCRREPLLWGK